MNSGQLEPAIRDAASVVLIRGYPDRPRVLVGQRGRNAVFMPNRFVFPGGSVDRNSDLIDLAGLPAATCRRRLRAHTDIANINQLVCAAVRELFEETGIVLCDQFEGGPSATTDWPAPWKDMVADGSRPSGRRLYFFFRAITPPGRTRRFDARFFLARLETLGLTGSPDDFSAASDELANLHWADLGTVSRLDLPSITRKVLDAAQAALESGLPPPRVPFHFQKGGRTQVRFIV